MIINNIATMRNQTNNAVNFIKDTQEKMTDAAKKIATGDVNVTEQIIQNKNYTQQVNAASKIIEVENKTIGVLIDTVA